MAQCITPYMHKEFGKPFPCGKCPPCRSRRASSWSFRLMQQDRVSNSAIFLTLTYDEQHIKRTPKHYKTIRKRCLQLYFKRVRKLLPKTSGLKYYACGEYGSKTYRPHYHAIIFNANYDALEQAWICNSDEYGCGHRGCGKPIGQIKFGTVSDASVGYTLKYISKLGKIPLHKNDDRMPEFSLMSKGLGSNYLTPQIKRWHLESLHKRMYVNLTDGKKAAMPRYYKERIYTSLERTMVGEYYQQTVDKKLSQLEKNPDFYKDRAQAHKQLYVLAHFKQQQNNKL